MPICRGRLPSHTLYAFTYKRSLPGTVDAGFSFCRFFNHIFPATKYIPCRFILSSFFLCGMQHLSAWHYLCFVRRLSGRTALNGTAYNRRAVHLQLFSWKYLLQSIPHLSTKILLSVSSAAYPIPCGKFIFCPFYEVQCIVCLSAL